MSETIKELFTNDKADELITAITSSSSSKIEKQQGVINKGKALFVGNDGNVAAKQIEGSDVTISTGVTLTQQLSNLSGTIEEVSGDVSDLKGDLKSRFYGKKISIIGDSIDTFNAPGYKIDGYRMYYPALGVTSVEDTWWKQVVDASGASLEVNASWSGSRVTNTYSDPTFPDFYDRVGVIGSPDVIFVTLGTNDSSNNITLGEYDFDTEYEVLSESTFRTAYIKGVKALQAENPNAQIICISEKMSMPYRDSINYIAEVLGTVFIDASDYEGEAGVHPGVVGMNQIASLVLYPTDSSLTQIHVPADAKEVGAQFNNIRDNLSGVYNSPLLASGLFVPGASTISGVNDYALKYRVVSSRLIKPKYETTLTAKDGYKIARQYFDETGTYIEGSDSGWKTSLTLDANVRCNICIRKDPEDASIIADISELISAINVDEINRGYFSNKSYALSDTLFIKANLTASGTIDRSINYRVASENIIYAEQGMYIASKEGYKIARQLFDQNGGVISNTDTGWKDNVIIPKNSYFKICIRRDPASTTVADIKEFVNSIIISSCDVNSRFNTSEAIIIKSDTSMLSGVAVSVQYENDEETHARTRSNLYIPKNSQVELTAIPLNSKTNNILSACNNPYKIIKRDDAYHKFAYEKEAIIKSLAHRGAFSTSGAPENTLLSYESAVLNGYAYIESDIRFTSDNVPVMLHDDTIDRTSDGSGSINELTYETVSGYNFDSGISFYGKVKIPTFEEYIRFCKKEGVIAVAELTPNPAFTSQQIAIVADIVKRYGMTDNVIWESFVPDSLNAIREILPNADCIYTFYRNRITETIATELAANPHNIIGLWYDEITTNLMNIFVANNTRLVVMGQDFSVNYAAFPIIWGMYMDSGFASDYLK